MSKIYQYFVEGECEEKLINALKVRPEEYLTPGKVTVFVNGVIVYKRMNRTTRFYIV